MLNRVRVLWSAALLSLLVPLGAGALTISPNPQSFSNGTDIGTITLVGTATGVPSGGTVLAGAVGVTDVSLIFQVSVTGGALESLGVGASGIGGPPFLSSTGAGWISGTDVDITSVTGTAGTRIFDFDGDGELDSGQTSDLFFVSYTSLPDDGTRQVNFMVNGSTGSDFTVSAILVVPEPGTLALVGVLGLGLFARRRRPARRSADPVV
jgi:hypothetical protein